ncbi:hypothetical protein BH20ACT11_BH20ACT11_09200 [soil metagenome]
MESSKSLCGPVSSKNGHKYVRIATIRPNGDLLAKRRRPAGSRRDFGLRRGPYPDSVVAPEIRPLVVTFARLADISVEMCAARFSARGSECISSYTISTIFRLGFGRLFERGGRADYGSVIWVSAGVGSDAESVGRQSFWTIVGRQTDGCGPLAEPLERFPGIDNQATASERIRAGTGKDRVDQRQYPVAGWSVRRESRGAFDQRVRTPGEAQSEQQSQQLRRS